MEDFEEVTDEKANLIHIRPQIQVHVLLLTGV
jgi:hypothetical protein